MRSPLSSSPLLSLLLLLVVTHAEAAERARPDPRPVRTALPRARADQEAPGRLMNLAQQQLARGEVDAAISSLSRVLETTPDEGFAWSLLADALGWGLGQGRETQAAWKDLADRRPDEPLLRVWAIRAEMSQHKGDKFTGKDTAWVRAALAVLDPLTTDPQPLAVRYAALVGRRDLLRLAGDREASVRDGVAAWTLDPAPLQGRITRIGAWLDERDAASATPLCLGLVETDPWAVEACAALWNKGDWKDAQAVEKGRLAFAEAVDGLWARAVRDPVLANEVHKLWRRVGDTARSQKLLDAVRKREPAFQPVDSDDWWKGQPFQVNPNHQKLFAETNRTGTIVDPKQRFDALVALENLAPAESADPIVVRWAWSVFEAGGRLPAPDTATQLRMLDRIDRAAPSDARAPRERARILLDTGGDTVETLRLLDLARHRLWGEVRPLRSTGGPTVFETDDTRRGTEAANILWLRARAHARLGRTEDQWFALREGALHAAPAGLYADLAMAAETRGDLGTARWADLEAAHLARGELWEALPADFRAAAARRWAEAHPEVRALAADAEQALRAAAAIRGGDTGEKRPKAAPKEQHPFVGQKAPDLQVRTVDGRDVKLADLRGRVVLVDFWATWCGPCKQEMPELEAMKARLAGKPVTFLMLSVDQDASAVGPFLAANPYTFDVAHIGEGATKAAWKVKGIPSLFVVGPDGVVARHQQGFRKGIGEDLERTVRELLP